MTAIVLAGGKGAHDPSWYCIDAAMMKSTTNYLPVWMDGFRGMSGYVGGLYDIPQKCIDAWWELPDTWWMLNYERDAHAGLGGAPTGMAYAQDALKRIRDKGHQRETALIFSFVDFGPTASQFAVLDDCHHAAVDECMADNQLPGFYGPPVYLRHLAVQPWLPAGSVLWQWGGGGAPEWWTTVKQAGPNSTPPVAHAMADYGFTADENILWTPMAGWTGYGAAPQPPTGDNDDMRHFVNNSETFPSFVNDWGEQQTGPNPDGSWPVGWLVFEIVPGGKEHVTGPEWSSLTQGVPLDPKVGWIENWTTGRIQQMPNVRHAQTTSTPAPPPPPPVDLSGVTAAAQQVAAAASSLALAIDALG